jgi:protein-S-isoprenylcysteine O-methyltransferase Ste14
MTEETFFQIGFWVLIGGVLLMRVFFMARVRRAGERLTPDSAAIRREGWWMFAFRVIAFFGLIGMLASFAFGAAWVAALAVPCPAWLRGAGFFLGIASLGLWTWTQAALGRLWSANLMLREKHRLITTGPYARIRHPLYLAMIGWSAGLALVAANWVFLALALVVSSVFIVRVPREEQMLLDQFGDGYRSYMERTGGFFPRL